MAIGSVPPLVVGWNYDSEGRGLASQWEAAAEVPIRDAIFRKMTNRNQTDTNEMTTTETKYQTDFYSAEKYQY